MKIKKALITGITGQDGSYLAELLLNKNYIVHGIKRKSSSFNTERIDKIFNDKKYKKKFFLHYGDLTDTNSINSLIKNILPDEIYNLAAQSHVGISFKMPEYTADVNSLGTLRILETIRSLVQKTKFYQASTSELYGEIQEIENNLKKLNFILKVLTLHPNYFHIGLQKIIGSRIIFLQVMEYCLTMNLLGVEKLL